MGFTFLAYGRSLVMAACLVWTQWTTSSSGLRLTKGLASINQCEDPGAAWNSHIGHVYSHKGFISPPLSQLSRGLAPLRMTRKVVFGYKYNPEKNKRKGTTRSKIYFDMYKDKHPLYVIHRFLHENDPDNPNFKYDVEIATKPPCTRHIFKHYKKDNKLRFFWYASGKNNVNGPCSRYINYARSYNEFRFSKLESYYHLLPYVHEHYKDDPRYIYFMNRFLAFHGRVAEAKRRLAKEAEEKGLEKPEEYQRTITWKEMNEQRQREEKELYDKYGVKEHIVVKMGGGKSFVVKPDGFKIHGEYYSRIDKKERQSPYDIYTPYYRTKHSSRRRRFRERGRPLNPEERCKTRRERLLKRKAERIAREGPDAFAKRYLKQKKSFKVSPPPGWVPSEFRDEIAGSEALPSESQTVSQESTLQIDSNEQR